MALNWFEYRTNLLELYNFLDAVGCGITEVDFDTYLEKPWDWQKEFELMRQHPDWNNYNQEQLDALQDVILQEL
jgi:hypothetical protein